MLVQAVRESMAHYALPEAESCVRNKLLHTSERGDLRMVLHQAIARPKSIAFITSRMSLNAVTTVIRPRLGSNANCIAKVKAHLHIPPNCQPKISRECARAPKCSSLRCAPIEGLVNSVGKLAKISCLITSTITISRPIRFKYNSALARWMS